MKLRRFLTPREKALMISGVMPARAAIVPNGFLMVFRQGDDAFAGIEAIMQEEQIPSASIAGFGFVAEARQCASLRTDVRA